MYLKGGLMDALLYRVTMGISVFGKTNNTKNLCTIYNVLILKYFGTILNMNWSSSLFSRTCKIHVEKGKKLDIL